MQSSAGTDLQCAGVYSGKVSVGSLDAAGSVGEARRLIIGLTGSSQIGCQLSFAFVVISLESLPGERDSAGIKIIAGGRTLEVRSACVVPSSECSQPV